MITKKILLLTSVFPMALCAQNFVKNGDAESDMDNWNKTQVQCATEISHSGKACFKMVGPSVISSDLIPVDTSKTYKISGCFKSADDKNTDLYFGLLPIDDDKINIPAASVNAVNGSETELAEECKVGDSVLKVKDASTWDTVKSKYNYVAFESDNSGKFKDLPNSKITSSIIKVEQRGSIWEVMLEKNCEKAYPANTPIRIQKAGAACMYPIISTNFQSSKWKEFTAIVKGESKFGTPGNQFWTKTKYVRIIILAVNGGMFYFDDIKFEEVK